MPRWRSTTRWCDRVPVYLVLGNTNDAADRQGEVFWLHSAQDPGALVRDMTKWDDNPASLSHFAESAVRAYKIAMTPPMGPVAIVVDEKMQEERVPADARIPKLNVPTPPAADSGAIAEAARLLVAAENPVILASRAARTPAGLQLMVELAETLQAGVVDSRRRLNFPTRHPLNGGSAGQADVVLALEAGDISNVARQAQQRNAKVISITATHLFQRSNYQDFMRYAEVDLGDSGRRRSVVAGVDRRDPSPDDGRAARSVPPTRRAHRRSEPQHVRASAHRRHLRLGREPRQHGTVVDGAVGAAQERGLVVRDRLGELAAAALGLQQASPVHRPRRRGGRRLLRTGVRRCRAREQEARPHQRLDPTRRRSHGRAGRAMDGREVSSAALDRHAEQPRLPSGGHVVPTRGAAAEPQLGAHARRLRAWPPNIDFAKMAESMGVGSSGPISDPKDLAAAIRRGIGVVKRGEPYLIDVVTQPR